MNVPFSPADFLAAAIDLAPPKDISPVDCPPGAQCRVSAHPIERGYRVMDVVTAANTEFLDQFRGDVHGYISEAAARCYKSAAPSQKHTVRPSWGFGARQVANPCAKSHLAVRLEDGSVEYLSPAFDPVTALANETLPWSRAFREVWEKYAGHNVYVLITPDFKRRLWPYSRAGILGTQTPVYILNKSYNLDGQFFLNWPRTIEILDVVEQLLNEGYSKASLMESLLSAPNSTLEKIGAPSVMKRPGEKNEVYKARCLAQGRLQASYAEKEVRPLRGALEFTVAVMIAARTLSDEDTQKALKKKQADREAVAGEKASKKKAKAVEVAE